MQSFPATLILILFESASLLQKGPERVEHEALHLRQVVDGLHRCLQACCEPLLLCRAEEKEVAELIGVFGRELKALLQLLLDLLLLLLPFVLSHISISKVPGMGRELGLFPQVQQLFGDAKVDSAAEFGLAAAPFEDLEHNGRQLQLQLRIPDQGHVFLPTVLVLGQLAHSEGLFHLCADVPEKLRSFWQ
jgi:hypothetical protein